MRVKGSMVMHVVKGVRGAGVERFDRLLSNEDRALVAQKIMPINWYPFANYKNLFDALVAVLARGNMNMVRQWGRDYGTTIIESVYRSTIVVGNPEQSLRNYELRFPSFYDFGAIKVISTGPGTADVELRDFVPDWEAIYQMISGWFERTVELAGGKNVRVEFVSRSWAGDATTVYRVSWDLS